MLHSRFVCEGERFRAHVAFTDRRGGFSTGPYASLNLAGHVGDDDTAVLANRATVAGVLGLPVANLKFISQVHGTTVIVWDRSGAYDPATGDRLSGAAAADAHVTRELGIGLVVLVADCVPVLLADPDAGVIAAVHAGRKGMAAGVVPTAVAAMEAQGAQQIRCFVGPSICPRCYEVPWDMREEVGAAEPATTSVSVTGTPALDVAAGVVEQLGRAGCEIVDFADTCTRQAPDLYSYRRDGQTGRFAGIVWLEGFSDTPTQS